MIKTYRLENLLMAGQITGEELDKLLENKEYLGAMYQLRSNRQALLEIASSPVALDTLSNSRRAIDTLTVGGNFLDLLFINETTFKTVAFSDTALSNMKVRRAVGEYYRTKPWKALTNITVKLVSLCYAPELDLHVGVGTNVCAVSSDGGETWQNGTLQGTFYGVCWNPDERKFVAVGNQRSAVSEDGLTWEVHTTTIALVSVCYGKGLYVGVGNAALCTSGDGANWVNRNATNLNWQSVCYAPSRRAFYAVNAAANTNNIGISGDGAAWSWVGQTGTYSRIAWNEDVAQLVISGATNISVADVSVSGSLSWSAKTLPATAKGLLTVCYASEFSLYAVLAGQSMMTSVDGGNTWDFATIDAAHTWSSISWDIPRRRFVCVSSQPSCLMSHKWSE